MARRSIKYATTANTMISSKITKYAVLNISGAATDASAASPNLMKRMSLPSWRTPSFDVPVIICAAVAEPTEPSGDTLSVKAADERVTYAFFSGLKYENSIAGISYSPSARAMKGY